MQIISGLLVTHKKPPKICGGFSNQLMYYSILEFEVSVCHEVSACHEVSESL